MNTDILSAFTQQSKRFMAPVQKLNDLAIANAEKLIAFQMASVRSYADLGMAQWKAAAEVNDPESFLGYLTKQGARMTSMSEQVVADAKKVYQMGVDFVSNVQKVAQENVSAVTTIATEKATSRKAAA